MVNVIGMMPFILTESYRRFSSTCSLSFQDTHSISQDGGNAYSRNIGNIYQTTRRHIPDDSTRNLSVNRIWENRINFMVQGLPGKVAISADR
jgi:hypothetical protein